MKKGIVFNIQHFSVDDGPGIRTTVFLKGCPLHCAWCHNPESHSSTKEILYDSSLCIGCGGCTKVCPNGGSGIREREKSRCTACGRCAEICPTKALELAGREMAAEEVLEEVLRDRAFYETSHGGITLSGGEPLMQIDFSVDILTKAKKAGLQTCVETCGYASAENIRALAEVTDLFLYDWKLTDSALHKQYTGADNRVIGENLRMLDALGKNVILRCPIIPGVNDTEDHFAGIAALANILPNVLRIELEPYHALGIEKSKRMGKPISSFRIPTEEEALQWQIRLARLTEKEIKIG